MATFLQLVTSACEECGVPTTNLSTVVGNTGELKQMVDWTARAWVLIQQHFQTWKFMRLSASWISIDGQHFYTPTACGITAGTFRRWKLDTFRSYVTGSLPSEQFMFFRDYDSFRDLWVFGANRDVKQRPIEFTVRDNDNAIGLGPAPLGTGWTFTGDYYKNAVTLAADATVPALPDGHDPYIIVARTKMLYGQFWGAKETYASGREDYRALLRNLMNDQLEMPGLVGKIA